MNLLQLEKTGSLKLKQGPVPKAGNDEVIVKVTHCALCRTDAKMWKSGQRDLVLPRVLGHEICGVIKECKKSFVVWPGSACGHCRQCKAGRENLCSKMKILGFHKDGGLAEYVVAPKSSLLPVPDNLPGDVACLAEPLSCTINALEMANVSAGEKVLIYGAGPVGLMAALAVKAQGAYPFITDINNARLTMTENFQNKAGIAGAVKASGPDFDVVINAAPSLDTFVKGIDNLISGGCFCIFSGFTDKDSVSCAVINEIHYRQLKVVGAYGCTRRQMEKALIILGKYKDEVKLLLEGHIVLEQVSSVLPKILAGRALKYVVEF